MLAREVGRRFRALAGGNRTSRGSGAGGEIAEGIEDILCSAVT